MIANLLTVALLLLGAGQLMAQDTARASARPRFMLVIHGGAGTIRREDLTPAQEQAYTATLDSALKKGSVIHERGGSSVDAVQSAIQLLEDSPLFNAGRGAVLTSEGIAELDAAIMDGHNLRAGAVAAVKHIKNPIALARMVMERTPHVMLSGEGAEKFARSQGVAMMPESYFITQRRREALRTAKHGTVGAVALDSQGRLAAGTSTGGLTNKLPGRIGDSPIIGAGTYANGRCAVSGTGIGEFFMRNVIAYDICARMEYRGESLARAADEIIMKELVAQKGEGGVIALDRDGNVAMPFNTDGMFRGSIGPGGNPVVKMYR
jgi:beta-aspartyl-peptidase (threonine type)